MEYWDQGTGGAAQTAPRHRLVFIAGSVLLALAIAILIVAFLLIRPTSDNGHSVKNLGLELDGTTLRIPGTEGSAVDLKALIEEVVSSTPTDQQGPVTQNITNIYPTYNITGRTADNQTLSVSGNILTITRGNSIALPSDGDGTVGNEVTDVASGGGMLRVGTGTSLDPYKVGLQSCADGEILKRSGGSWACAADAGGTSYTAGNGLQLVGTEFSVNSPTCAGTAKLQWNGSAFVCSSDVDTDTDAQTLAWVGGTRTLSISNGNSVVIPDADTTYSTITNGGLRLSSTQFGLAICASGEILKAQVTSGEWACAPDADTNTTYTADGNGIELVGTTFSLELNGTTLSKGATGLSVNLSNANTWNALQTFGAGATITTGQTITINGDAFTDLTGTGLTISAGTLQAILGSSVELTSEVTGVLPVANGGTNLSSLGTANQLLGVNSGGTALEYKNLSSLLAAGAGISLSGTNTVTITNTGAQASCSATSNYVCDGGNTLGASLDIGTTDANAINFVTGGATVATLASGGAATFQNSANSATSFRVLNATSVPLFVIDTTNSRAYVGDPTADATGALLVLDTKNTIGDPTAVKGGMYYNSENGRNRCYEDGTWTECTGTPRPNARRTMMKMANGTDTTWEGYGATITNTGTVAADTIPRIAIQHSTTATSGNVAGASSNVAWDRAFDSDYLLYQTYAYFGSTTDRRVWLGFTTLDIATMGGSSEPASGGYAAFRYDTGAGDTTFKCVVRPFAAPTIVDSGVTVTAKEFRFEVFYTFTETVFKINGDEVCRIADSPSGDRVRVVNSITTLAAAAKSLEVSWMYVEEGALYSW
ncbi:MAG: hypothetical protein ACREGJ_03735 [Candidatus Saccharimonadales bacterium]